MTIGRDTEDAWMALLRATYPDARDDEFVRRGDGAIFFRHVRSPKDEVGQFLAAWFPQHACGFVEVMVHG